MGIEDLKPHQFKPGQSGNPNGYSRGRRITDRLCKIIEEKCLDETIALTWLGAALGDDDLLEGRKPNAAFFAMLIDRLEGKVAEAEKAPEVPFEQVVGEARKRAIDRKSGRSDRTSG